MHSDLKTQSQLHPALNLALNQIRSLKPDQFEIYFERSQTLDIDSRDQKIETFFQSEDLGLAIRIMNKRKVGFSFTTSLHDTAVRRSVEQALEMAAFMPEDEHVGFHSFQNEKYPHLQNLVDSAGLKAPVSQKMDLAKELESIAKKQDSRITAVRTASISQTHSETHLVDSNGTHIQYQKTLFTSSLTCKAEAGGDSQVGSDFSFSPSLAQLDIQSVAREASEQAIQLLNAGSAPTLKCPAVLKNSVVAELIEFLAPSFSAEQIEKSRSLLAGRENKSIFAPSVTLIHDGLLTGGYGTRPFDAEGVVSEKKTLVHQGILNEFLYNPYYARKKQMKPSGCSVRGIKSLPSIGYSNFYMEKGTKSFDHLIQGISKGVFITELMGVHTANPVTGDFSLGASGVLIENGRLARPIRGFAIAGNVLTLFKNIFEIGSDLRFFGKIGAPSVQLSEISISGV